ncbi:hypothetical protein PLICRDRAFT_128487 [Plicaturopsis crispa FD-325 SS-3]|nr:hypothetical protein PLICRDRAFT_128487 [Plicaturopsis crispa FD-325 SS-3]
MSADGFNPKIASLAERLVAPNRNREDDYEEEDEDALFAELEEEIENDSNAAMREQGLLVLRQEMEKMKEMRANEHGSYTEIMDEKEVIRASAKEPRCVIHFYHSNFRRCEIMDKHLAKLAPKYFHTRFLRVFVENVPWLVEKLAIKVLPCVICFIDGVTKDRMVGFEELGNNDAFDTATLELRLAMCGVIEKTGPASTQIVYNTASGLVPATAGRGKRDEDEELFDLDE